eukprot:5590795-Prymnesium_polylepis.1
MTGFCDFLCVDSVSSSKIPILETAEELHYHDSLPLSGLPDSSWRVGITSMFAVCTLSGLHTAWTAIRTPLGAPPNAPALPDRVANPPSHANVTQVLRSCALALAAHPSSSAGRRCVTSG